MLKARFGIRTMMFVVVLAAMLLGALRFILLILDCFGSGFLYFLVSSFTLYVFLPMLVIVESIFALGYFWLRRRRVHQTQARSNCDARTIRKRGDRESVG